MTWPLAARLGHATWGGPGDGWALIWQTRVRLEHGISYLSPTFTRDIAWPFGAEVPSAILLSNATLELPHLLLLALGVGDVAAYNVITFTVSVASSVVMALVLRRLGCRPSVAFWGGLAYLLAPWHLEKIAIHPTLASMACLPLLLLGIVEWTRKPSLRTGALLTGAAALCVYSHAYYGIGAALVLLAALPIVLVVARRERRLRATAIATAAVAVALVLVPLPLALALAHQSSLVSGQISHPVYLTELALRPHLLVLPASDNPLFGELSGDYLGDRGLAVNDGELALYLGVLTIALAAVAVVSAVRGAAPRLPVAVGCAAALIGLLFATPSAVDLPLLGVHEMPVHYLSNVFEFISAPARFFALTLTGTVVLAALGLEQLAARARGWWPLALVAGACVVSAVELPFHRDGVVHDARPTPLVRAIEEVIPDGAPIAQYPSMDQSLKPVADQLFYQLQHRHPVLSGGYPRTREDGVRLTVWRHLDPKTPGRLARLGYRWLTYDEAGAVEQLRLVGSPYPTGEKLRLPRGYRIVRRLPDGSAIMRIVARPAPLFVAPVEGFDTDGWMVGSDATLFACSSGRGLYLLRFDAVGFARDRRLRVAGRPLTVTANGPHRPKGVLLRLDNGCQFVAVELVGSEPDRPIDVIPGSLDTRGLVVNVGTMRLSYVERP